MLALPRVCALHSSLESQVPEVTADKQSILPPSFLHLCPRAPGAYLNLAVYGLNELI